MLNKFDLQGRLVRDVELRWTKDNKAVAQFTIVWSEKFGDKESKLFIDCVAWGKTAENLNKFYQKGSMIIVSGKLAQEEWKNKDGETRKKIKMTVNEAHFCGSKNNNEPKQEGEKDSQWSELMDNDFEDGLPF